MSKIHRSVVRNKAYSRDRIPHIERHNERKNEHYGNGDVDLSRSSFNVHFKTCDGSYLQQFDNLVESGTISTRGLKPTAKIIDELVYDVNSEYFEERGGYEFAKSFFESAYQQAIKEVGGEEYILSAVLHADEKNKALSERLGRDVYHYHLHVVYIPVVEKQIKWTKRCKDPALVGTVKETIMQVSNSKKWVSSVVFDEDGIGERVPSYSPLQDRYFEYMKQAGFTGFERGEKGSSKRHLSVTEYKTKQEQERLSEYQSKTKHKKVQVDKFEEIDSMAGKSLFGKITLTADDWETVRNLAREGFKSREIIKNLKNKVQSLTDKNKPLYDEIATLKERLAAYDGKSISDRIAFSTAMKRSPQRLKQVLDEIRRNPPEVEQLPLSMGRAKSNELE